MALLHQSEVFVEAVVRGTRGAVVVHQVQIEGQRVSPRLLVELGLPVHVEPLGAKRVGHSRQEGHVLAPASFATQADAVLFFGLVGHGRSGLFDVSPSWGVGHGQASGVHQVFAVHHHRAFAVEGRGVQVAIHRQTASDCGQQVGFVVIFGQIIQRHQPALLAPDRNFVGADGQHVKLTAFGGDVGCDFLAQDVFFQRHPVHMDVGVLGVKVIHQPLHPDHVAVVHGGHSDLGRLSHCHTGQGQHSRCA